jgi:signal transduction histidine kinase
MAESLEQAEHVRRELTADIAHELRNPLAVLQANLEALSDGVYPAKAENFAPAIDQIHLLNRLVEDLRTLALADAGQLELALVQTNLLDLARRVAESYQQQAAEADVAVRVDGEPVAARADPMRVEQILGNLIGNAIRHTGRGHAVLVRAGPSGDQAELVVSDQGPGIAEEDLPRIFERFYRAERSRSRAEGGTGLGLAIARQLAAWQGGEVRAANRLQGGAEFTLVLPRWREA